MRVAGCVSCGRCSGSYSLWISCVCWCVVSLGWGLRLLWVFGLVLGVGFVGAWFWCCSWLGCFDFDVVFVLGFTCCGFCGYLWIGFPGCFRLLCVGMVYDGDYGCGGFWVCLCVVWG